MKVCPICKHLVRGVHETDGMCPSCGADVSHVLSEADSAFTISATQTGTATQGRTCPLCNHRQTDNEKQYSPAACAKCGRLYPPQSGPDRPSGLVSRITPGLCFLTGWLLRYGRKLGLGVLVLAMLSITLYFGHNLYQSLNFTKIRNSVQDLISWSSLLPDKSLLNATRPLSNADSAANESTPQHGSDDDNTTSDSVAILPPPDGKSFLEVTSRKNITLWFIEEESKERTGPYLITRSKTETLRLKKGRYTVQIIENNRQSLTSFIFEDGVTRLDL